MEAVRGLQQEKLRKSHHRSVSGITAEEAAHVSPWLRRGNYRRRSYARLTIAPSRVLQQGKLRTSHHRSISGITAGEATHVSPSLRLGNNSRGSYARLTIAPSRRAASRTGISKPCTGHSLRVCVRVCRTSYSNTRTSCLQSKLPQNTGLFPSIPLAISLFPHFIGFFLILSPFHLSISLSFFLSPFSLFLSTFMA